MTQTPNGTSFSLDDLRKIMRSCAGLADSVDLTGDIGGVSFKDLGYDSLAVLQMASSVENELAVPIPDDAAENLTTPQSLVDYVTAHLEEERDGRTYR
jgi:act minimal PKS acyl carrier protein